MISIRLALSTDAKGHPYHATLIASILRRTEVPVHVRCWCRGFLPESFESGPLEVEFIPALDEVTGNYPASSGPAAYDRLLVIRKAQLRNTRIRSSGSPTGHTRCPPAAGATARPTE